MQQAKQGSSQFTNKNPKCLILINHITLVNMDNMQQSPNHGSSSLVIKKLLMQQDKIKDHEKRIKRIQIGPDP